MSYNSQYFKNGQVLTDSNLIAIEKGILDNIKDISDLRKLVVSLSNSLETFDASKVLQFRGAKTCYELTKLYSAQNGDLIVVKDTEDNIRAFNDKFRAHISNGEYYVSTLTYDEPVGWNVKDFLNEVTWRKASSPLKIASEESEGLVSMESQSFKGFKSFINGLEVNQLIILPKDINILEREDITGEGDIVYTPLIIPTLAEFNALKAASNIDSIPDKDIKELFIETSEETAL